MQDSWFGLLAGFLGLLLGELRRRQGMKSNSIQPPPPDSAVCKRCFFFRQYARSGERDKDMGDTQLIHRIRFDEKEGQNGRKD
jgi:hypothetical protein